MANTIDRKTGVWGRGPQSVLNPSLGENQNLASLEVNERPFGEELEPGEVHGWRQGSLN